MDDKTIINIKGCEEISVAERDGKKIKTCEIYVGGLRTMMSKHKISQIVFSAEGLNTGGEIALNWADVKKVVITDDKKQIGVFCKVGQDALIVTIPNQENMLDLIKTYCPTAIQ